MFTLELTGNLTKNPERKSLPSGTEVVVVPVAVNQKRNGMEITQYIDADAYGKIGETAMKFLTKGRKVFMRLDGLKFRAGENKVYISGTIKEMEMLGGQASSEEEVEHMKQIFAQSPKSPQEQPTGTVVETPSDLPWDMHGSSQEPDLPF